MEEVMTENPAFETLLKPKKKPTAKKPKTKPRTTSLRARKGAKAAGKKVKTLPTRKAVKTAKPRRKATAAGPLRSCRMDIRLTTAEKAKLQAKAAKTRRTVTSVIQELIEKLK